MRNQLTHPEGPWKIAWERARDIPGSFTQLSCAALWRNIVCVGPTATVVEVGVDQGRSASIMMEALNGTMAELFLFDSWESVLVENYGKVHKLRDQFQELLCYIERETSLEASEHFEPESIDLIHIDANHYAPNPENDLIAWLPKVKKGGTILMHDYDPTWPDVVHAVDKHMKDYGHIGCWDSLVVKRKHPLPPILRGPR